MASYRVRRDIPGNTYTQVKSTTLAECKRVLRSIRDKWNDLKNVPFEDEEPFEVDLKAGGRELVVTQGERVVDRYVVEGA